MRPDKVLVEPEALSELQRRVLLAVYAIDQEAEQHARQDWHAGRRGSGANTWRWLVFYSGPHGTSSLARRLLGEDGFSRPGVFREFASLERAGLLEQGDRAGALAVRLTRRGRALARQTSGEQREAWPKGQLREWQWAALGLAYAAGDEGLPIDTTGTGYGGIRWATWLRLRDYKPRGLVETFRPGMTDSLRLRLTEFGLTYYRQEWERYRGLYPKVEVPGP